MNRFLIPLLFLLPVGCKGSSSSASVGVNQEQTNTQIQNESELDCNISCTILPDTGLVTVVKDCQGGATAVVTVSALPDNCTSVNETTPVAAAGAQL